MAGKLCANFASRSHISFSGECSLRKAFSSLVGYVSQSFIKALSFFFKAKDGHDN